MACGPCEEQQQSTTGLKVAAVVLGALALFMVVRRRGAANDAEVAFAHDEGELEGRIFAREFEDEPEEDWRW